MARLLRDCGVWFCRQLAQDYPPALIEASVAQWRQAEGVGPGMLVKMIQQGGLAIETGRPRETHSEWLERRYRRAR